MIRVLLAFGHDIPGALLAQATFLLFGVRSTCYGDESSYRTTIRREPYTRRGGIATEATLAQHTDGRHPDQATPWPNHFLRNGEGRE